MLVLKAFGLLIKPQVLWFCRLAAKFRALRGTQNLAVNLCASAANPVITLWYRDFLCLPATAPDPFLRYFFCEVGKSHSASGALCDFLCLLTYKHKYPLENIICTLCFLKRISFSAVFQRKCNENPPKCNEKILYAPSDSASDIEISGKTEYNVDI